MGFSFKNFNRNVDADLLNKEYGSSDFQWECDDFISNAKPMIMGIGKSKELVTKNIKKIVSKIHKKFDVIVDDGETSKSGRNTYYFTILLK